MTQTDKPADHQVPIICWEYVEPPDRLVPDRLVCDEFSITPMTLWRWDNDPDLQFPSATKIRNRNYRSRRELEAFKARMLRRGIGT